MVVQGHMVSPVPLGEMENTDTEAVNLLQSTVTALKCQHVHQIHADSGMVTVTKEVTPQALLVCLSLALYALYTISVQTGRPLQWRTVTLAIKTLFWMKQKRECWYLGVLFVRCREVCSLTIP